MEFNFIELLKKGFALQAEKLNCKVTDLRIAMNWSMTKREDEPQGGLIYTLIKDNAKVGELNFTNDIMGKEVDVMCTETILDVFAAQLMQKFIQELEITDAALIPLMVIFVWFDDNEMTDESLRGYLKNGKENIREINLLTEFSPT